MQAIPRHFVWYWPDTQAFFSSLLSLSLSRLSINFIAYQKPLITHQREWNRPGCPRCRWNNNSVRFSTPTKSHELTAFPTLDRLAVFCVWHNRHRKSSIQQKSMVTTTTTTTTSSYVHIHLSAQALWITIGNPYRFRFRFNWNSFAVKPLSVRFEHCLNT